MNGIVKVGLAVIAGTAVIGANPKYEKNFVKEIDGSEQIVTISWDFVGIDRYCDTGVVTTEKHFSIEKFVDGDVNDAFVISKVNHNWNDVQEWNTWNVEYYKNVDEVWFNIEFGK